MSISNGIQGLGLPDEVNGLDTAFHLPLEQVIKGEALTSLPYVNGKAGQTLAEQVFQLLQKQGFDHATAYTVLDYAEDCTRLDGQPVSWPHKRKRKGAGLQPQAVLNRTVNRCRDLGLDALVVWDVCAFYGLCVGLDGGFYVLDRSDDDFALGSTVLMEHAVVLVPGSVDFSRAAARLGLRGPFEGGFSGPVPLLGRQSAKPSLLATPTDLRRFLRYCFRPVCQACRTDARATPNRYGATHKKRRQGERLTHKHAAMLLPLLKDLAWPRLVRVTDRTSALGQGWLNIIQDFRDARRRESLLSR